MRYLLQNQALFLIFGGSLSD